MAKKVAKMDANFWANKKRKSQKHLVGKSTKHANHTGDKVDDGSIQQLQACAFTVGSTYSC